jgi:hypothetical protein
MLAGYETTSTTLSYCTYVLATHPEEQQKLFEEISNPNNNEEFNEELNADKINKYEYLDMFIKEVIIRKKEILNYYSCCYCFIKLGTQIISNRQ